MPHGLRGTDRHPAEQGVVELGDMGMCAVDAGSEGEARIAGRLVRSSQVVVEGANAGPGGGDTVDQFDKRFVAPAGTHDGDAELKFGRQPPRGSDVKAAQFRFDLWEGRAAQAWKLYRHNAIPTPLRYVQQVADLPDTGVLLGGPEQEGFDERRSFVLI